MSKIFDTFIYHNESDMAELRFNILAPYVDRFVVCEASETHSGNRKDYDFDVNGRFAQWREKIIYIQCGNLTDVSSNSWHREAYHRSCIGRGLVYAEPDDWVMCSDVDEIVSPDRVQQLRDFTTSVRQVKFEMDMYYYNFNCKVDQGWAVGAARHKLGYGCNEIRRCAWARDDIRFFDAGFHASYFMSPEQVIDKVNSFMHHNDVARIEVLPRDAEYIKKRMDQGVDLYGRDIKIERVPLNDKLPRYVLDNRQKYIDLGWIIE